MPERVTGRIKSRPGEIDRASRLVAALVKLEEYGRLCREAQKGTEDSMGVMALGMFGSKFRDMAEGIKYALGRSEEIDYLMREDPRVYMELIVEGCTEEIELWRRS